MHFCSDENVRCVHCVFPPYCILMINDDNSTKHELKFWLIVNTRRNWL